jgi:catechol-2,3-dioxygenase
VSHGTTWSVYFRDPEGNRLELFADTPWHVAQPLRFPIDLTMADDELIRWTERKISALANFQPAEGWFEGLESRLAGKESCQD